MKHFIDPQQVNSPVGVNPTSRLSALERSDPTKLVADTLLERLNFHVVHRPKQVAYRFLADQSAPVSQSATTIWTYQKLHRHALQVAHSLLTQFEKGVGEGVAQQRVLLVYPPGLELIAAFLGCLSVGTIAIPVPPPRRHESLSRWQHILTDAQATGILTSQALASELASEIEPLIRLSSGLGKPPSLRWLVVEAPADEEAKTTDKESLFASLASRIEQQSPPREAIAFLQYTSGSTSQPKGAMVTHGNLAHNLQQIQQFFGHDEQTQGVIWLPPYHDMGLIGGILQPLYGGYPVTLMSPSSFLRRPARWLEAISHFGATTSGGPNFAYDYCVKKIAPNDCRSLDLSSWQVAFTGAESIQAQTLRQFSARFQDSGFNTSAFYPCYGLAESTLLVSGGSPTVSPNVITLDQEGLLRHRVQLVESVEQKAQYQMNGVEAKRKTTVEVVSCGKVVNQLIRIVNPSTGVACEADEIGEIWLSGESVAAGYWGRVEATHQCFRASLASEPDIAFLRTGDLGFVHQGELFITGRLKDLIVIRGQNYYPQDIEVSLAEAHAALLPASAAFSINNKGEESLAIAQEVSRTAVRSLRKGDLKATEIITTIRSTVSYEYGLHASAVVLLKPGQLPRTTSGKIQRHRCKQCFETGEWDVIEQSPVPPVKDFKEQQSSTSSQEKQEKKAIEEQTTQSLVNWLRKYAREHIDSRQMDERRCLSPGLVLDLGNQGLLGMQVPAAYGGLGLGHQSMLTILQQLGAIDLTLALFVGLNNVLGIRPILRYGSDELKEKWLPRLAAGRELAAFALTETGAGSHPMGITAQAVPTEIGWHLNGQKIWSGSAAWAGIINVFVQAVDEAGSPLGITGFAVEKGTPGLKQGPEALTTGMRGMVQNTVLLDEVPVSSSQRLGVAGAGMDVAQDAMCYGRLAIAAACVGGMKRCAQLMLRYSKRRQVATGRLLDNPVILTRLSWLRQAIASVESLVTLVATRLDAELPVTEDLYAACKIIAPELYWQAIDYLMQSLGGRGYIETNLAPQMMRDARVLRIFEGPTEVLAMHLGARTVAQPEGVRAFFDALSLEEIGEQLSEAVEQILRVHLHQERSLLDLNSARRQANYKIGQIVAWAFTLSALKTVKSPQVSIDWGQQQFEQAILRAIVQSPDEAAVLSAKETAEWIDSYRESIGEVDSLAAIAELDEFLQPDASQSGVLQHGRQGESTQPLKQSSVARPLSSRPETQREKTLVEWMVRWISGQLNVDPAEIVPTRAFADYGLDSVMAVELAEDLSDHLALSTPLDATLAWNFPTISALASHLATITQTETPIQTEKASAKRQSAERKPIALTTDTASLDQLSDAELAEALSAELATVRRRN